ANLRLSAKPQQNEIVTRQNRVDDLRNHGVVISDDAGKNRGIVTGAKPGDQIVAQLILHAAGAQFLFGKRAAAQFAEGAGESHRYSRKAVSLQPSAFRKSQCDAAEWFDYTLAVEEDF